MKRVLMSVTLLVGLFLPALSFAGAEETSKGQKLPFDIKLRVQARLDFGDLLVDDNKEYETESDFYLRRVRLEIEKKFGKLPVGKDLKLNLTLEADKWEKDLDKGARKDPKNEVSLLYAYGDWKFVDEFGLRLGKAKLPYSRVSLTSSSRQLIIERPKSTEAAKKLFGDYYQPHVMLHGKIADGMFRYALAYAEGANNLNRLKGIDKNATDVQKKSWGDAFIGRIEFSPGGLVETKMDDTGMGGGNFLTLGIHAGTQGEMKYKTSSVSDATVKTSLFGADLAVRYNLGKEAGALTGQVEYTDFKRDFNYKSDEKPKGYYVQIGYLLPFEVIYGKLEPAARYEVFDHDSKASDKEEKTFSIGFNHYIAKHKIKWAYNFINTKYDNGVALAVNNKTENIHQIQIQFYF